MFNFKVSTLRQLVVEHFRMIQLGGDPETGHTNRERQIDNAIKKFGDDE